MGCDRFWDVGSAIAFGDIGSAIAVLRFGECDRCLGMLGVRSLFGDVWSAIAVWDVGMRSLLGCGGAIAVWDVGSAITVWGC
ncbi:hypothetical protein [Aphanizomenon sp. UHCC 0183]|uniref:hypothetical protein n=1 Tax=Aphanizomenon sp. UHCC 0183 TaxID=2590028 RepID=UPI0014486FBC|nr:hypothetical protein [Aphanizomenon sp. UHCC 0183]MTJ28510.1 hypothetical protein [Aphanizomenon sp. UHCC 0183]